MSIHTKNKKQPPHSIYLKNKPTLLNIMASNLQWIGDLNINRIIKIIPKNNRINFNNFPKTVLIIKHRMITVKNIFRAEAKKYSSKIYLYKKRMTTMDVQEELKTY